MKILLCPKCGGTGRVTCGKCKGIGYKSYGMGGVDSCAKCLGSGTLKCPKCLGSGREYK